MRRRRSLRTASATPEARCALEGGRTIQLRPDAKDKQTTALPGSHHAMRKAGVLISLSFDATSIAPPNMFETMRFTWNMGIPWRGTPTEQLPDVSFREVIQMATLNGATALGIADTTGSITVGKRADLILIRGNDLNVAPVADIEASVVQSANVNNVDTVLVDGRIVKRG